MHTDQNDSELPVVGRDINFSEIKEEMCIVHKSVLAARFEDGKLIFAPRPPFPYGYLEVECNTLSKRVALPIAHKQDALHVWKFTKECELSDDEEFIVFWTDRSSSKFFETMSWATPRLWLLVFHKGYYKWQLESKSKEAYTGDVPYIEFIQPIRDIKPESMG